jgi:hypothetical protein
MLKIRRYSVRKYENVDIVAVLGTVMEINTGHYKSDYKYDIEMFNKAVSGGDDNDKRLLWLSRPSGTECFRERDILIRATWAFTHWTYYADTRDSILAYAVEIIGKERGKVRGNLYELDYAANVKMIRRAALPVETVLITFEDGEQRRFPYKDYDGHKSSLTARYGAFKRVIREPADEHEIQAIMKLEHAARQKYNPAVFKPRIVNRKEVVTK